MDPINQYAYTIKEFKRLYNNKSRLFRIYDTDNNKFYGKYYGKTPKQAACKACRRIINDEIKNGNQFIHDTMINFYLVEFTPHLEKQLRSHYCGHIFKYESPIIVNTKKNIPMYDENMCFVRYDTHIVCITYNKKYIVKRIKNM